MTADTRLGIQCGIHEPTRVRKPLLVGYRPRRIERPDQLDVCQSNDPAVRATRSQRDSLKTSRQVHDDAEAGSDNAVHSQSSNSSECSPLKTRRIAVSVLTQARTHKR